MVTWEPELMLGAEKSSPGGKPLDPAMEGAAMPEETEMTRF